MGLIGLLLTPATMPTASAYAMSWLERINNAATKQNFAGTFVYVHDDIVEAIEVARRVVDGRVQERLYSLTGEAREVVRDHDNVWCFIPGRKLAVLDYREVANSGFPHILPTNIEQLMRNYHFEIGEQKRIAGRIAQQVKVMPNDNYRYGYHLWADEQSGLLLRSDLLDQNDQVIEQYLFVKIQIGGEITDAQVQSATHKDEFTLYRSERPNSVMPAAQSRWQFNKLPNGYSLSRYIKRALPMDASDVVHMVLTDGLSTVSIFVKPLLAQDDMQGLVRLGAIHVWYETIDEHRITVIGEVPAETVKMVAKNISQQPSS